MTLNLVGPSSILFLKALRIGPGGGGDRSYALRG